MVMFSCDSQFWVLTLLILFNFAVLKTSGASVEIETLLKFKQSLSNTSALDQWKNDSTVTLCIGNTPTWRGLRCKNGELRGLRLEAMGLNGIIDVETLAKLPNLRTVSFKNNTFEGPMPDFRILGALRGLFLSNNRFSGKAPDDAFSDFPQQGLVVNFANNNLEGPIPSGLSNNNWTSKKKSFPKVATIVAASVGGAAIAVIILAFITLRRRSHSKTPAFGNIGSPTKQVNNKLELPTNAEAAENKTKRENGNLLFVRDGCEKFELRELLRSSAEVLGSGSFGSSYKTILLGRQPIVVRRFRRMNTLGRDEFHERMKRLGRLSHPNLLPLVAFYSTRNSPMKLFLTAI